MSNIRGEHFKQQLLSRFKIDEMNADYTLSFLFQVPKDFEEGRAAHYTKFSPKKGPRYASNLVLLSPDMEKGNANFFVQLDQTSTDADHNRINVECRLGKNTIGFYKKIDGSWLGEWVWIVIKKCGKDIQLLINKVCGNTFTHNQLPYINLSEEINDYFDMNALGYTSEHKEVTINGHEGTLYAVKRKGLLASKHTLYVGNKVSSSNPSVKMGDIALYNCCLSDKDICNLFLKETRRNYPLSSIALDNRVGMLDTGSDTNQETKVAINGVQCTIDGASPVLGNDSGKTLIVTRAWRLELPQTQCLKGYWPADAYQYFDRLRFYQQWDDLSVNQNHLKA